MNETVTKRFLLYFRLMLLAWILVANAVIHLTGENASEAVIEQVFERFCVGK